MDHLAEFVSNHLLLSGAFAFVLCLTALNEWQNSFSNAGSLEPAQAVLSINRNNAMVLDIRTKEQYDKGHIINSKLTSNDASKSLKYNKQNHLIVVCENGSKSSALASSLKKEGFENASILKGGIQAWNEENLPLESTSKKNKKKK